MVITIDTRVGIPDRDDMGAPSILSEERFRDVLDQYGQAVHRYITSRVGPEAAEDVMAEVFAAAWKSRAKVVDQGGRNALECWLVGIASRLIAAHRRVEYRWLRMCADTARQLADRSGETDESDVDERADADELTRNARIAEAVV